jgi:hypothetical protein
LYNCACDINKIILKNNYLMLLLREHIGFKFLLFAFLLILINGVEAQNKKPKFTEIKISGYFRNYITFRNMQENYISGGPLTPRTIMVNGIYRDAAGNGQITGYREPLMMIVLDGKPSANTAFTVDFLLDNQMTGQIFNTKNSLPPNPHPLSTDSNAGKVDMPRRIQAARWLNLGGSVLTKYGQFEFKAGGVINMNITAATMNFYQYRDDMFERYPWESQMNSFKRYQAYYNDKNVVRDPRLGSASVQGFTLKATQLPFRTGFLFVYGKANNTGGYQSFLNNNNQALTAGQISKKFSTHSISANYYQSRAILKPQSYDKSFHNIEREQVATGELNLNFKGISIVTEGGAGTVSNPVDSVAKWTPLLIFKANIGKEILPLPLILQYYYIGTDIVNLNSSILNTSNRNVQSQFGNDQKYNTTIFEGAVTEFGQLANNRQGVNLSTSMDVKKHMRLVLSLSSQQELENRFNMITYQHRLNGFNRSQFEYYRNGSGPYARQMNTWRRSWEKVTITDSTNNYLKGFNLIDLSVKYKTRLFKREIIFSNYINYNSVQDKFAPVALLSSKAFLRNVFEEFMIFYNVKNRISVIGLMGVERTIANSRTLLASNGKPIDQTGYGYGGGIDFDLSPTTGLYFRQRFYSFSDKNFVLDKFRGYDTTVELKIFF